MKNILSVLIIIVLFIFCFVLEDKNKKTSEQKPIEVVQNLPLGVNGEQKNKQKTKKQTKKNQTNKTADKNKKILNFPKMKKVFYPSSIKNNKITFYVNNPTLYDYPSYAAKAEPCLLLKNKINSAQKSIDFALFEFGGQKDILNALNLAKSRGVILRGVVDGDENGVIKNKETELLKQVAQISQDFSKSFMHNKIFIIDDDFVMTGSMNITNTGCGGYNSNSVVVFEDEYLASIYKKEFEQMYEGKFKRQKFDYSTPLIKLDEETSVQIGFSPIGGTYYKIVSPAIKGARHKIRVSAYILTYGKIIQDLIEAKNRGVEVLVILDALNARKYKKQLLQLKDAGIKVKAENWGGKNHEKTMSVDDDILILGSTNFTYSGFNVNDENIVIIKNKTIANFYNGFFDTLYNSIDSVYLNTVPYAEGAESGNSCFDKIDNDFDGKIDMEDYRCKIYKN